MIVKVAWFLAEIYVPTMWAFVAVHVLVGVVGLVAPDSLRGLVGVFTRSKPVRVLGLLLLVVGTEMFLRAPGTAVPLLVKTLGVVMFVHGGVCLFVPTVNVIIAERCTAWAGHWYRLSGLLSFGIAYLFYLATKLPLPPGLLKDITA